MASAIGLRGYLITAHRKGEQSLLPFASKDFVVAPPQFLTNFVNGHNHVVQNAERERSWYFEQKIEDGPGNSRGYTHYGTFGFESNFVDSKTKVKNYRRKVDDIEEIPLFYEFWWPDGAKFAFAAFQSFQGRSCIGLVMDALKEEFEALNPGYILKYQKLLPSEGSALYSAAPVKVLRLIKRNVSQDVTDRYLPKAAPGKVNFEVKLSAGRNQILGSFGGIAGALRKSDAGLVLHDGVEFTEAYAEVKIGGKYRPVGVFGSDASAGVIDISQDIKRGPDGHPTFDSIIEQCDKILSDFFEIVSNKHG
jgi:hypothetical protein